VKSGEADIYKKLSSNRQFHKNRLSDSHTLLQAYINFCTAFPYFLTDLSDEICVRPRHYAASGGYCLPTFLLPHSIHVFPPALADYTPNVVSIHPPFPRVQFYWLSPRLLISTPRAPSHIESTSRRQLSFLLGLLTLQ
jgi:hypothetical protein